MGVLQKADIGSETHRHGLCSLFLGGLLLVTAVRLAVAAFLPLSADEAYYWVWSRALAPGYLDHPPGVAVFMAAGAALGGETAFGVRLLSPLAAAAGTVLLADAGGRLFPGMRAGWRAAVLLNATLMLAVGAVTMTPDAPLLLFWTGAAYGLARVAAGGSGAWWIFAGLSAGLAFDGKYTAALLLPAAVGLLLCPAMRFWWRSAWPWLGAAAAVVVTAPVLMWNARHGWASLVKQGGRTGDWQPGLRFVGELIGGQVGLATPVVFGLFCWGVAAAVRRWREPRAALIAGLVVPGAVVFLQHAVGDRVQANWVAVLYPGCALAAAGFVGGPWRLAAWVGFGISVLVYGQAVLAPLPLPRGADPSLRLAGWHGLAAEVQARARAEGLGFVASEDYGAASLLAWWGGGVPVLGAEDRWRFVAVPRASPGGAGLLLVSARRKEGPDPAFWRESEQAGVAVRARDGVEAERYRLYRVMPRADADLARLPQRRTHAAADDR